jgi:hypothetical protein
VSFVTSLRQIPDASEYAGEPGVIGKQCNGDWCEMSFDGHTGWIGQAQTWGELSFPEYGPRSFKAPPGGAVVFSGGLLHAVSKVTRWRRYAFLPFLVSLSQFVALACEGG